MQMLAKINKLTNWQAALIIAVIGFAVFFIGLKGPFMGDDQYQIVNNVPVHSITNIRSFFEGGTFYTNNKLVGVYFRPIMTTTFSLLYTIFGSHPLYFHLFQLLLCIASAIILFNFLKCSFTPVLSLALALIFLVHPINSQVAYAIPAMQDALFFFFGILALWLLLRFKSTRGLLLVVLCLLLSILSKETGLLFIPLALLYLFWWDRRRLLPFLAILVLPLTLWLILKIRAVGLSPHSTVAPIDKLGLGGRLMTSPSIVLFYLTMLVFPLKLAESYFWTYPHFSFAHVLLPLGIDIGVAVLFIYAGFKLSKKIPKDDFRVYLFFAVWALIGLMIHLQIVPLDMTAVLNWFYFPIVGILGMIGVILTAYRPRIKSNYLLVAAIALITILGLRTMIRGLDYGSEVTLAYKDIAASREDYLAYNTIANMYIEQGNYQEAKLYARQSISIYPNYVNSLNLGIALANLNDCPGSMLAFNNALKSNVDVESLSKRVGELALVCGDYGTNKQFLTTAIHKFPTDAILWMDLAVLEDKYKNNDYAKFDISKAASYGQINQALYDNIINNRPYTLTLADFLGNKVIVP